MQPVAVPVTHDGMVDLDAALRETPVRDALLELDRDLIGLQPVKRRVKEVAGLLLLSALRAQAGFETERPTLHMSFTGRPGTGKTTVAMRMAKILHLIGYVRKGHLVVATRDDLVGQYVGHTAPKTKEVVKRAMGGVLFIDEAYYLYRPENERDYGQEAIEMLLQVMENHRDDLVVILAGYGDRMETFFRSNPGFHSRIAHHLEFPDYSVDELLAIAEGILDHQEYEFDAASRAAFREYLAHRMEQPHFSNARSVRNALDRAKLRQAARLLERGGRVPREELRRLDEQDIRQSRVFRTE